MGESGRKRRAQNWTKPINEKLVGGGRVTNPKQGVRRTGIRAKKLAEEVGAHRQR